MKYERAKLFLRGYQEDLQKIKRLNEQIEELFWKTCGGAIKYSDMPKGTNQTDLSDYMAKRDTLEQKWQKEVEKSLERLERITDMIENIPDEQVRTVLHLRYIKGMQWEDMLKPLPVSWATLHRYHTKGLEYINNNLSKDDTQ